MAINRLTNRHPPGNPGRKETQDYPKIRAGGLRKATAGLKYDPVVKFPQVISFKAPQGRDNYPE
jgi:hypothetical protein